MYELDALSTEQNDGRQPLHEYPFSRIRLKLQFSHMCFYLIIIRNILKLII
jgi:hypothetical protein